MLFRLVSASLILATIFSVSACGRKAQRADTGTINLDQNVTVSNTPKDVIFVDFKNNWRKFVSEAPEFILPVARISDDVPRQQGAEPIVLTNCVFSAEAGGYVPQVTIIWTEATGGGTPGQTPSVASQPPSSVAAQQQRQQQPSPPQPGPTQEATQAQTGRVRFDLAVHLDGFERNFFSTALSDEKDKRFNLPANSDLVRQEEALLLTGPSLFPKLMDYRTEVVRDRDANRDVGKQTLILRDLSQGLSYNLRMSSLRANQWQEERGFVFSTPVCPNGF